MTIKSRHSAFGDFRAADYIKLYWVHVDVTLRDIFVRQRTERNRLSSHQQPLPLDYCVLEGVGAVVNSLRVGQQGEGFDRFIVEIAGYIDREENLLTFELRPSAKMVWIKTNYHTSRLDIYIPNNLSHRLIELYVTKRIDRIKLHTQIAVIREEMGNLDGFPEGFPLLGDADHLYFRHAQCGLAARRHRTSKTSRTSRTRSRIISARLRARSSAVIDLRRDNLIERALCQQAMSV